jgi:hypothetical protein
MHDLEVWLQSMTIAGLLTGAWGILWARASQVRERATWGRWLFVGTLLVLGGSSLVAAFHRADGLVPLGLSAGFLVSLMLIEGPRPVARGSAMLPLHEET